MALGRFLFSREFKSIQYRKILVFHLQNQTIKIRPLKSKNPLKNQGICGRYLFHRPFMAEGVGFEPTCPKDKRFSRPPRYDRFDIPASVIFFVFPKRSDARSSLFRRSRSLHDAPHFDRFDIPASVIFYKLRNVTPITKPIIPHQKVKVNPFSRQK